MEVVQMSSGAFMFGTGRAFEGAESRGAFAERYLRESRRLNAWLDYTHLIVRLPTRIRSGYRQHPLRFQTSSHQARKKLFCSNHYQCRYYNRQHV
jgi:hypothetical protein